MRIVYCHLIADLWVDDTRLLERAEPLERLLLAAAKDADMKVISAHFHQFEPYGATGVLLLEQSHLAVHTWVDEGLACIDLMTCGDTDPEAVLSAIRQALPGEQQLVSVERRALSKGQAGC